MSSSLTTALDSDLYAQTPHSTYLPRVAIVTGAAQGIGYAIAHRLADDGIDVAVNDILAKNEQLELVVEELKSKGRRALAVPADVSSEDDVRLMVEKTAEEFGSVDIVVANAGIGTPCSFLETSVQQLDSMLAINVRGVFLCYKYGALQMIKQGRGGRLIGASSSAGKEGTPNLAAYSATKFAIRGLTQTAAIELRKHGITTNAYAPGIIYTKYLASITGGEDKNCTSVKQLFGMPIDTPVAEEDVVTSIVSYLTKPEAYFINGQSISVDGGLRFD